MVPDHKKLKKAGFLPLMIFIMTLSSNTTVFSQGPLMRFPDIHENLVVFVHGEDIWSVPATGGIATRLTINDGEERYPKISPDGSMIAFTGYYDGNPDVYVMNKYGGNITRLTYHPSYDQVIGWHPAKNKIIFNSYRPGYPGYTRLYLIKPDGTGLEELIMHEAAQGSFSPDGSKIAYNKVSRENRTWKRYQGGTAQEVYIYDFVTNEEKNISNYTGTDRLPMWIGDKIYFASDRDRILNIYYYDLNTATIQKVTNHSEYDVRRPSAGGNKIIYEHGGELWILDAATGKTEKIKIRIETDLPEVRPYLKDVKEDITGIGCSPNGERALINARGEIFSVPYENGPTRNLTNSSGARDKDAVWSPDGRSVAFFSDKNGEYNLYLQDQKGEKEAVQLTDYKDGYRHTLRWSLDSKKLAFTDQELTCYIIDISSKEITRVDKAYFENIDVSLDVKPIYDFNWSPDSRFLAYSKMDEDLVNKVYIYSLDDKSIHCISTIFNDFHPVFSNDGQYLFFVSNRRFDPTFCDFEWEMVYKKTSGIYCLTLQKNGLPFNKLKSDEVKTDADKEKEKESEDKTVRVVIDWEGLTDRIEALPLNRGNYRYLSVNDNALFYLNRDEGDFNRFEFRVPNNMDLYRFNFEEREEAKVIEEINLYVVSANGKKIAYKKGDDVGIIEASESDSKGHNLNLADLKMWYEPRNEWKQIFNEAWRMERDFYYEPNMHGLDWDLMREKYGNLISLASCRQDVQYIIGELIGELNTSHTYIYGGDRKRTSDRVSIGMLGADFKVDTSSNRYFFSNILKTSDWTEGIFPPLSKPGIHVKTGDYLLKVNGMDITADKNIYSYFQNLAGKQVTITVNGKPDLDGAKEFVVEPLSNDYDLRYQEWAEKNRLIVDSVSGGKIGYIHFPDTYTGSTKEFPKYFYSQTRKEGLIIDGRFNGGGLDPEIFFDRLRKKPHSYWTRRYSHDQTSPAYGVRAHMVCLTNRQAGSGGDELPFEFRQFGMGPVIGTRTWGGLVGVSMFISLIDGGGLTAPDYRIYTEDGKWVIENEGVTPDIIVELKPTEVANGFDAQLMKGVDYLLQKIREEPITWPRHPSFPEDN
ncbi:MAG: PD40 domain-containing protein [Bacteroidales bacterium]|nr:PD40 domain-containing protein [Bacteroidales bacterium]